MIGESIIAEIQSRVIHAVKQLPSMMTDDHSSLWMDYQDHVDHGYSDTEQLMMDFIKSKIHVELDHLPSGILKALWWNTEKGSDALCDAEWLFQNGEIAERRLGNPPDEEVITDITNFIVEKLARIAEEERMERMGREE